MGMGFRGREASRLRGFVAAELRGASLSRNPVTSFSICKLILHSYLSNYHY